MYTRYFGFNEKPFTLTPNPRFIYLSTNHKEAFAHLLYGINNHYGFIGLTGEIGTGKTTVLRSLLGQLPEEQYCTALIFNPCLTGVELLRSINSEFGIDAGGAGSTELLAALNRFLLAESARGRTVVLVIDEAQNLPPAVLEQLRLISNLETEHDKLVQIVLAGQPELEKILARSDLRQLNQRIAVRYRLGPMKHTETAEYIRQRMETAGETGGVSFSRASIVVIHLATRGVPRLVNILCDRCLLIAYGNENRRITSGTALKAVRETLVRRPLLAVLSLLLVLALLAAAVTHMPTPGPLMTTATGNIPSQAVTPHPDTGHLDAAVTEAEVRSYDRNDFNLHAVNAFTRFWGVPPLKLITDEFRIPESVRNLGEHRGLRVTELKGTLDDILRLGVPFLAITRVSEQSGAYCLAVTGRVGEAMAITPPLDESQLLSYAGISAVAGDRYLLIWRNSGDIPDNLKEGESRYEVIALQQQLKRTGYFNGQPQGNYSEKSIAAVTKFQQDHGIAVDRSLGEMTLAVLSLSAAQKGQTQVSGEDR